jgi:hypothetical protein
MSATRADILDRDPFAAFDLRQPLAHTRHKFDFLGHFMERDVLRELREQVLDNLLGAQSVTLP